MSEEIQKCQEENETFKMICEVEKNYRHNFTKQAELFKTFFEKLKDKTPEERIQGIKDFISKQTPKTRLNVLKKYGIREELGKDVLYLGIPGSLGRSYSKVEEQVIALIEILKGNNETIYQELEKHSVKVNATTTSIMYLFFPEKFIPIAGPVEDLLKKLGIDKTINSWQDYQEVITELKEKCQDCCCENGNFKPSFTIALSFTSWLMENQVDNILNKFIDNDEKKPKNIILTGIPGTGKTHTINEYLKLNYEKEQYEFVQFHPSYDYEDFIEGLKPIPSDNGQIEFKLVNGVFKELCKKAFDDKDKTYVMVIDEINRANLSRVFGELLYCLEYRGEFVSTKMTTYIESLEEQEQEKYSVSKEHIGKFAIPNNLIILGTMNEVDRSIDAFDLALRRRFIWEEIGFSETALRLYTPFFTNNFQSNIEILVKKATQLNTQLFKDIGMNYQLGHTYYFKIIDYFNGDFDSSLCDLWEYHLKSIIKEYCKVKFAQNEIEDKLKEYKKIIVDDKNCNG